MARHKYAFGRNKKPKSEGTTIIKVCLFILIIGIAGLIVWSGMQLTEHHTRKMTPPASYDDHHQIEAMKNPSLKGSTQKIDEVVNLDSIRSQPVVVSEPIESRPQISSHSIYSMHAKLIDGNDFDFSQLVGKVSLIVNVASK